jgi:DNA primase
MGLIPEDIIADIRERADIVAIIGRHVQLRKAGRSFKGLCPFHQEKSPSFSVSPERGFFYCFGCQKKGDAFTFLMEYEGRSFAEATEILAQQTGVALPDRSENPARAARASNERARLLELNRVAAEFYQAALAGPGGQAAQAYLESRRVHSATARAFQLGYAPPEWGALSEHLRKRGLPLDLAEKAGLVVRQARAGGFYDRFRDRLMCPVHSSAGDVVGFSGRRMADGEEAGAKYINSPESPVFKKSRLLYGLPLAREGFRRAGHAVLVEGNFDVISLHQAGFDETVAPLGTALTEEQAEQLRRLVPRTYLLYDGDRAGRAATLRALQLLLAAGLEVRIVELPAGEDPDSLLGKRGADGLRELIGRAQPAVEYFAYEVWSRHAGAGNHGRAAALTEAAEVIRSIRNGTERDLIVGTLASAMQVDIALVRRAVARSSSSGKEAPGGGPREGLAGPGDARSGDRGPLSSAGARDGQVPRDRQTGDDRRTPGPRTGGDPRTGDDPRTGAGPQIAAAATGSHPGRQAPPRDELAIVAILADHPHLIAQAEGLNVFSFLTDGQLRDMYSAAREGQSVLDAIPAQASPFIAEHVLAGAYADVQDPVHCLEEAVSRLRATRRRGHLEDLQRRALEARRRGDVALERQLVREIMSTRRQVD